MEGIGKVQGKRKKTRPPRGAAGRSNHSHPHSHPLEVRRKAVQLYLEEGFSPELIAREMSVGKSTLSKWLRLWLNVIAYSLGSLWRRRVLPVRSGRG